jgi:FAD/FMN-containing dehydrogenase
MDLFKQKIKSAGFKGEIDDSLTALNFYSHDASLFEIKPKLIVFPSNFQDVEILVFVADSLKASLPDLSLTARSAGTCMSGGSINDSIIVDFAKYFNHIETITENVGRAQPGVYYRDFETETLKNKAIMPSYPASRDLCTIGGMVANNAGGEKSLEYGKTENFVTSLNVVLADGKQYQIGPLNHVELNRKLNQHDFEGFVYKKTFELIKKNYDKITSAKPKVTKNSTGYNLWDVWDRDRGVFDLTKLFVGSQGTLGFVTDIQFRLVPTRPFSGLLVCFLKNIDPLGEIINTVMAHKPATFESFDDHTLYLSLKFFPSFRKMLGTKEFIKLMISLIPDGAMLLRGIPKLILMIEFNGQTQEEVDAKILNMKQDLVRFHMAMERDETAAKSKKFWIMRRQSFNLLRNKVKDKHTAPFIDDLVVTPPYLVEFLPKLRDIIKKYNLLATIAGHMGDGNFHIIPLMKLEDKDERDKLLPAMKEVNNLILAYKGSLSGEHNDGLIRGPWLEQMYGSEVLAIFKEVKTIFDPKDIFNPHKKADADWDYSFSHIRDSF